LLYRCNQRKVRLGVASNLLNILRAEEQVCRSIFILSDNRRE
jgi:hypothetical protein